MRAAFCAGSNINLQIYVSVTFTLFVICFLVHMLACFFYVVGSEDQTLPNNVVIAGWVARQRLGDDKWDASISLGTRYVTSMYLVLNALENGATDGEKLFAVLAEFTRDFILGLVAGLITSVSMSMNSYGDQERQVRLRALKNWMQKKKLPPGFQVPIASYCNEMWTNRANIDIDELFDDVPPTMRRHLTNFLYAPTVTGIPMFRQLSSEVIGAICSKVRPLYVMAKQLVIVEGEPGNEMYMIITGELEVMQKKERLGFLSEGSFFGESAIMCREKYSQLRTRTVTAVTESELCYLTDEHLLSLVEDYPELHARLNRFHTVGAAREWPTPAAPVLLHSGHTTCCCCVPATRTHHAVVAVHDRQRDWSDRCDT